MSEECYVDGYGIGPYGDKRQIVGSFAAKMNRDGVWVFSCRLFSGAAFERTCDALPWSSSQLAEMTGKEIPLELLEWFREGQATKP